MLRDIRFSKGKVNTYSVYESDNEDDFLGMLGKSLVRIWQILGK